MKPGKRTPSELVAADKFHLVPQKRGIITSNWYLKLASIFLEYQEEALILDSVQRLLKLLHWHVSCEISLNLCSGSWLVRSVVMLPLEFRKPVLCYREILSPNCHPNNSLLRRKSYNLCILS